MRIEVYSWKYEEDVFEIVRTFHDLAFGEYDPGVDADLLTHSIKTGDPKDAFILIDDDDVCQGILYGKKHQSPTSGQWIYQEILWYTRPPYGRYGVRLLREAEKMLKSEGVSIMIMAVLENFKNKKIKRLYKRLGFKPIETHYMRAL